MTSTFEEAEALRAGESYKLQAQSSKLKGIVQEEKREAEKAEETVEELKRGSVELRETPGNGIRSVIIVTNPIYSRRVKQEGEKVRR